LERARANHDPELGQPNENENNNSTSTRNENHVQEQNQVKSSIAYLEILTF